MTQMFAATHYPFGLDDTDEGAAAVEVYAVSTDRQALVDAIIADMEDNDFEGIDFQGVDNAIHISADDGEVYYVVREVNVL